MITNLRIIASLPNRAADYWRFMRSEQAVTPGELSLVLFLATITVFAEAAGLTMLLPILSYVEHGGDLDVFSNSSRLTRIIFEGYAHVGVPVSLISLSVAALTMIVLRQCLNYANSIEIERIKWRAGRRLTVRLFEAVLGSSADHIRSYKSGKFINTAYNECQGTAAILRSFCTLWMLGVTLLAYTVILLVTAPVASAIAFGVILVVMICLGTLIRITNRLSRHSLSFREAYANFLTERFRAWKLIKLANTLELEKLKADAIQQDVVGNQIHLLKVASSLALIFVPLLSAFLLMALYIFVEVLRLEVAVVMAFFLILLRLMPVSQSIQGQLNRLAQFLPSYEVLSRAFASARATSENLDAGKLIKDIERDITFENVSFAYSDREHHALSEIFVKIPARKLTAIVGTSGAGKSTFVDLIPRLVDPTGGTISIDGVPLGDFSLRSLRRLIAYVPQEPFLFDATIAENIRYLNPDASEREMEEAAVLANAAEFIDQLPKKYDTPMGEAGAKLSGGQKQRIVLARAFLSRASILILDESTSALDYESEAAIQQSLEYMVKHRNLTVLVIAHRLSTIRNAEFVIHLQEGMILRTGSARHVLGKIGDSDSPVFSDETVGSA